MRASLRFSPGNTIRWRARRFMVVDYASMDAIIAQEIGKRSFRRIPIKEAAADLSPGNRRAWAPDLVSVSKEAWQTAVKRFKALKPLLELDGGGRTLAKVSAAATALAKHPSTLYRWMDEYERTERLSVFLRKERSDRGKSRSECHCS
jgi:putative transposase